MTRKTRLAIRKRKERNQQIIWILQDIAGLSAIFVTAYLALIFGWALL